jgi:hypothetical protein
MTNNFTPLNVINKQTIYLYNMNQYLVNTIEDVLFIARHDYDRFFDTPIFLSNNIKCILMYARDEENVIYTFDKNNKIKVIIPQSKLISKISESKLYIKECEFNKYLVELIEPSFDIKIGFSPNTNSYYANFVLMCVDYTKYERQKQTFGSVLERMDHKRFSYVDKDQNKMKIFFDFFTEVDFLNKAFKKLKEKNYFGYENEKKFFEENDYLFLSDATQVKCSKNEEETSIILNFNPETNQHFEDNFQLSEDFALENVRRFSNQLKLESSMKINDNPNIISLIDNTNNNNNNIIDFNSSSFSNKLNFNNDNSHKFSFTDINSNVKNNELNRRKLPTKVKTQKISFKNNTSNNSINLSRSGIKREDPSIIYETEEATILNQEDILDPVTREFYNKNKDIIISQTKDDALLFLSVQNNLKMNGFII